MFIKALISKLFCGGISIENINMFCKTTYVYSLLKTNSVASHNRLEED